MDSIIFTLDVLQCKIKVISIVKGLGCKRRCVPHLGIVRVTMSFYLTSVLMLKKPVWTVEFRSLCSHIEEGPNKLST